MESIEMTDSGIFLAGLGPHTEVRTAYREAPGTTHGSFVSSSLAYSPEEELLALNWFGRQQLGVGLCSSSPWPHLLLPPM